jgi:hypothetical protein
LIHHRRAVVLWLERRENDVIDVNSCWPDVPMRRECELIKPTDHDHPSAAQLDLSKSVAGR